MYPNKPRYVDRQLSGRLKCEDYLLQMITTIINRSTTESVILLYLERANITALLKISWKDKKDKNSYSPLSNFPSISQLNERVAAMCKKEVAENDDLRGNYHCGYRRG